MSWERLRVRIFELYQSPCTLVSILVYILRLQLNSGIELLKNELSVVDLVGPTLPALKLMWDKPPADAASADPSYAKLVHGLLSSCLQNVDECSGRSGAVVALKTKNNLLAAVLVLTVIPATMKISKAALEQCAYLISQKLGEGPDVRLGWIVLDYADHTPGCPFIRALCEDPDYSLAFIIEQSWSSTLLWLAPASNDYLYCKHWCICR
jgi:hypothetical protein